MPNTWDTAAIRNQSMALGRGGIWFVAGVTVGRGWLSGETALTIAGAILTLIGGGVSAFANTNSSITQAFAQIPEVKQISVSDPKLAEVAKKADPETKVVVLKPIPKED
jgi:hypothetical protein